MVKGRNVALLCVLMSGGVAFGQSNLLDGDPNSPTFNNPSFERPDVQFAQNEVDAWTESGPNVLTDTPGGTFPTRAGVGVFENPATAQEGRIAGADGTQLGYIFSHTLNDFFTNQPVDHALTQVIGTTFNPGAHYQLTIGFANAQAVAGTDAVLTFSLFAYDASNPAAEQLLAFDTLTSSDLSGTTLTDFAATTPAITGDAVGKQIGIRIHTRTDPNSSSVRGQFDYDNVRLTVVPEPAGAATCVAASSAGLLLRRAGRRRRR
jgi:hypothetical protein